MMFPSFSAILVLSTLAYSSYAVPILSSSNVVPWSILKWPSYPKAEVKVLEQVAAQASKLILDSMLNSEKEENKDEAEASLKQSLNFGNLFDNIIPNTFPSPRENKEEAKVKEQSLGQLFGNIPSQFEETDKVEEQQHQQQTFADLLSEINNRASELIKARTPLNKHQKSDADQARDQFFTDLRNTLSDAIRAPTRNGFPTNRISQFPTQRYIYPTIAPTKYNYPSPTQRYIHPTRAPTKYNYPSPPTYNTGWIKELLDMSKNE